MERLYVTEPDAAHGAMKSASSMLGGVLAQVAARSGRGAPLAGVWASVVGETVALHSTPRRLAGKVLVIACDAAQWRDSLRAQGPALLQRLQAAVGPGEIEALDFQWP
jgi:predicted nucleic acid-binding Zn ribbon protein